LSGKETDRLISSGHSDEFAVGTRHGISRLYKFTGTVVAFWDVCLVPSWEAASELGAAPHAELAVNPAEMELDSVDAQIELSADLLATQAISSEEGNSELGWCERAVLMRSRPQRHPAGP
jgi:hypothetical protein